MSAIRLNEVGKLWVSLDVSGRVRLCKLAGLPGRVGSKSSRSLSKQELTALSQYLKAELKKHAKRVKHADRPRRVQ